MTVLVNGNAIAKKILADTKAEVSALKKNGITPTLGVILVGNHAPSRIYVRKKRAAAKKVGINFILESLKRTITTNELIKAVETMQRVHNLSGLIIQLPLPLHIADAPVLSAINPALDVDCLTAVNLGKLVIGAHTILPPTANAIMSVLKELRVELVGKNVTIIGTGALVGKPLAIMMINEQATVTTCNCFTSALADKTKGADIIVSGVGRRNIIRGNMIKQGAIVIDAGVEFIDQVMYGDVNREEVEKKARSLTPTPGGIGPITVALLLQNTARCARNNASPSQGEVKNSQCFNQKITLPL
ncbi:MAG: Bifunctional protein FolD [Parcubacteria group bacterium GW2011_GWA2_44_12]|nr:MAG: Bifunctional protein FolD [Parcubacteria group bacterium GW2011_GWA2_44_12]